MSPELRIPTSTEIRLLNAARLVALTHTPYFAHALFAVKPVAAVGLGTFAVDRGWRLYFDPEVLEAWGPQWSGGVLVHEVSHLVRQHAARAATMGGSLDHERWNYACDAAINDDLINAKIPLPDGAVTPDGLGLPPAGIEEAYYLALPSSSSDSSDGCGSGAGDPVQDWELDNGDARAPALSTTSQRTTRQAVAEAVTRHAAERGNVPSGLKRWADESTATPPVPWRRILASAVRKSAALVAGRTTYSYSKPGRRRIDGIVTPGMRAPRVRAALVIDTSGSMTASDLAAATSQVDSVIKAVGGFVDVITCDAEATRTQQARSKRMVRLNGGGGTDMRVGIAAAEQLIPRPDLVIVLTDGYTPWPERPTRANLIVALINNTQGVREVPAWARTVTISTGN